MIYPVRIRTWFVNKKSPFHEDLKYLKRKLPELKCMVCGNPITLNLGYVSYGFAYGYQDDNYCSKKCMATKYRLVEKNKGELF